MGLYPKMYLRSWHWMCQTRGVPFESTSDSTLDHIEVNMRREPNEYSSLPKMGLILSCMLQEGKQRYMVHVCSPSLHRNARLLQTMCLSHSRSKMMRYMLKCGCGHIPLFRRTFSTPSSLLQDVTGILLGKNVTAENLLSRQLLGCKKNHTICAT